jgi:GntR family transcriptional regulator
MSVKKAKPSSEPHIPLHLSLDDPEPMYRQIESQLRDFILGGQLEPGTRLPSMRALARDLSCSVITTRRAYEDLEGEGFIRTRQGMGTLVAEMPEEKMAAHRREAVDGAIREAVRAGRRAGLTHEELRGILEETLQREDDNVRGGTTWPERR